MPRKKLVTPERVLILKTVDANMRAYGGFKWPTTGHVTADRWDSSAQCGNGLHGFLWGVGNATLASLDESAKWVVFEADADKVVELDGKVKAPEGDVVFVGKRDEALAFLDANGAADKPVIYGVRTAGYGGTATAGYRGTATAGNGGTATAGYGGTATAGNGGTATAGEYGTATAGEYGTATAGNGGTATAGYRGTATAGYGGTATAGYRGTATAGNGGTATAGEYGTATAGNGGTATAGEYGTATAGNGGTATAGEYGIIQIARWDVARAGYRIVTGYVGEDGVKADTLYKLSERTGKLVVVKSTIKKAA